jgi:hypothetical protein
MAGASLASWLVVRALGGTAVHPEALYGMLGPLASACATWVAVWLTDRAAPTRLTAVLVAGFALKMLFFGAYVAAMLRLLELRAVPFVVSFTAYFIALYAMEALFLQRLARGRAGSDRAGLEQARQPHG